MKNKANILIKDCQKQKKGSEKALYEHFFSYGMSVSLRYTATYEEAVEILNDSYMKVFKTIKNFKNDTFKGWFRRIIINTATDHYRKMKKFDFLEGYDAGNANAIYAEELITAQLSYEDLLGLVQQLSPSYRTVFNLYAIDGYKHEEIAKTLGITTGASKSNLSRARQILKGMIKKTLDYEFTEAIG
ncbi:MAG: RNA polymerase sigma factor [Ekhidna sp.]